MTSFNDKIGNGLIKPFRNDLYYTVLRGLAGFDWSELLLGSPDFSRATPSKN